MFNDDENKKNIAEQVEKQAETLTENAAAEVNETAEAAAEVTDEVAAEVTAAAETEAETVAEKAAETAPKHVYKTSMDDDENRKGVYVDKAEAEAFLAAQQRKKKRNKIITISVCTVIALVFIFIIYKVVFGGNVGYIKFSDDYINENEMMAVGEAISSDSGMTLIAEAKNAMGGTTQLKFSPKDSLVILTVSNASGKTVDLRSWPAPSADEVDPASVGQEYETYNSNHNIISSLVRIGYTASNLDGGKEFGINQIFAEKAAAKRATVEYNKISNGFRAHYTIPISVTKLDSNAEEYSLSYTFEFVVEIYLNEDGNLTVNVPKKGVVEAQIEEEYDDEADEMPRVASIEVMPYFGAAKQGDEGYFVTPDGSGSLTYFDVARISTSDEYQKRIYGYDDTFDVFNYPNQNNETISMPVFGVIKNDVMITCFATESEANASIVMGQPGVRSLNLYYINYKFKWREFYESKISKSGQAYTFLEVPSGIGDFTQVYDVRISDDEDYSYVDMAALTQEFLLNKWNADAESLEYLANAEINSLENKEENPDIMNVKIFFADVNKASVHLFTQLKVMTTFEQAKDIIADCIADNARIRFSLLGWQNDGYYGNCTRKYNIESALGGASGLKELNEYGTENGTDISADVNLLIAYSKPKNTNLRVSVVKDAGTNYLNYKLVNNAGVFTKSTTTYYISPTYYQSKLLNKDIKKLGNLGFKNVDLEQLGNLVYTDYNKEHPLLRQQAIEYYRDWIVEYKKAFNTVSVYYGYEYAASVADSILDIPMTASMLFIEDESVPFIQLVYHGIIDYYSSPVNRTSNTVESLLKSVEYGAFPSFEVTEETTETLRYTTYNALFKAQYSALSADIKDAYVLSLNAIAPVANAKMTSHSCVDGARSGNVYCTVYDNGYSIYVNYGSEDYNANGVTVPATGVTVVSGGSVVYTDTVD